MSWSLRVDGPLESLICYCSERPTELFNKLSFCNKFLFKFVE